MIFSIVFAPWFLSLTTVIVAIWFVLSRFDPIRHRNAQPQNTSHYQLPYNDKPSKSINSDDMMFFYVSATELGRFLREKRITSTNLIKKYIERMTHVNPSINAAINYRFSQALDEAVICDDVIHQLSIIYSQLASSPNDTKLSLNLSSYNFEDYPILASLPVTSSLSLSSPHETLPQFLGRHLPPFFGVPCTTKECFALKGMPHTAGLVSRRSQIADYTSPVILNMQRSGLIIMATSNTSELCMWMESQNLVYGQTRNPYSLKRTPGGSSGGEGALLGSLSTPISLGSDVGGSIRMPAFFNGVYGHKPTSNYVSCLGQVPSSRGGIPDFFCQAGPMARYPADLWPMLQVMVQTHYNGTDSNRDDGETNNGDNNGQQNGINIINERNAGNSILNLQNEMGLLGEKRKINLMARPSILLADVVSVKNEYSTTHEGKTIIDQTSKHYHNKHGIAAKYDQNATAPVLSIDNVHKIIHKGHKNEQKDQKEQKDQNNEINPSSLNSTNHTPLFDTPSDDMVFVPYPHQNSKYYDFNSLQTYTQENYPILTSSHPDQIYYNNNQSPFISPQDPSFNTANSPTALPPIHKITPYQVDYSKVVVYNLKDFGSSFPPVSRVDPILIHQQHEVAQFYANMGCTVYEIDVDKMIAFYKKVEDGSNNNNNHTLQDTGVLKLSKNPNFFIPIPGQPTLTDQLTVQVVPGHIHIDPRTLPQLEVFREFVNGFEYWSAGMTLTFSAFRELLLQDCTREAMEKVQMGQRKKKLQMQNDQVQMALSTKSTPVTTTIQSTTDSAHDPYGDYTSHEELSKYTTLSQDVVENLDLPQKIIYQILLVISTFFHSIRLFLIKMFLPLDGIPHFGEVEGAVEIRRQNELREYLKQQRMELIREIATPSSLIHEISTPSSSLIHDISPTPTPSSQIPSKSNSLVTLSTPIPTPSIRDIHPPMPLETVMSPSMPLLKRILFEIRVAVYIIYHLCLSCCSRQLVPVGTLCLAETQGERCWHDTRPVPGGFVSNEDNTDLASTNSTTFNANSTSNNINPDPTSNDSLRMSKKMGKATTLGRVASKAQGFGSILSSNLNMTPKILNSNSLISLKGGLNGFGNAIALPATSSNGSSANSSPVVDGSRFNSNNGLCSNSSSPSVLKLSSKLHRKKKLYDPNAPTDDEDGEDVVYGGYDSDDSEDGYSDDLSGDDNDVPVSTDPFISTIYPMYLQNKAYYGYCNCTRVLQSSKQVMLMNKKHNHITIANIFSSFLPMTPYTFPALLLGLIDRVGDLTPAATLASFNKCLRFSQKINNLLAPSLSQPFGGVILAPPHPMQAPGHFTPCTKPFNFVYTGIFNATMTPVTSVPTGLYRNLPTGIQIVGARHCDVTTIAMALLVHEQWGGWQPMKRLHSKYHVNDRK